MVVMSRKHRECLVITTPAGEEIQIQLLDASRDSALLGLELPADYIVSRDLQQQSNEA